MAKLKSAKINFFDIYTKLYLTIPQTQIKNIQLQQIIRNQKLVPLRTFIMQQHRRTRLNQLNYLDHPLFGVLIKITKQM